MPPRRKLGDLLIEMGAVPRAEVDAALADQSAGEPARIGDILLSSGKITPVALAKALAKQHGIRFVELSTVDPKASALMPLEFLQAHRVVPFRLERDEGEQRLHVAVADPTVREVMSEIEAQARLPVSIAVAAVDDIEGVLQALSGEVMTDGVLVDAATESPFELHGGHDVTAPHQPPTDLLERARVGERTVVAPVPAASMPRPRASPTIDDLFGSIDLDESPMPSPPVAAAALSPPDPPKAPAAKSPPPSSPAPATSPSRPGSVLGRLALKKVAVAVKPAVEKATPGAFDGVELPAWMNAPVTEQRTDGGISPELEQVLEALVRGDLDAPPPGAMMAAVVRVLVSRGMLDEAALLASLGKK